MTPGAVAVADSARATKRVRAGRTQPLWFSLQTSSVRLFWPPFSAPSSRFLFRRYGLFGLFALCLLRLFGFSHRWSSCCSRSNVNPAFQVFVGDLIPPRSILAADRLSPSREAQPCEPQELTFRLRSAPCIR